MQNEAMPDLFSRNQADVLDILESRFLSCMAWYMQAITYRKAMMIMAQIGIEDRQMKPFVEKLQRDRKITITGGRYYAEGDKLCTLATNVHLQLLWQLRNLSPHEVESYDEVVGLSIYRIKTKYELWRNVFIHYAATGQIPAFPKELDSEGLVLELMAQMYLYPEWEDLFSGLPGAILIEFFRRENALCVEKLLPPNTDHIRQYYLENKKLTEAGRRMFKDFFSNVEYVLSGRVNEIPQKVPGHHVLGNCAHAIYHQYHGRHNEAVKFYHTALKTMHENFYGHPFYDLTYILALVSDTDASSKKKLSVLSKKRELRENMGLLPARLLLKFALHEELGELLREIAISYTRLPPVVKVLLALIIKHYQLKCDVIDWAEVQQLINKDHLKLFQLEYSQDFPSFVDKAESLQKELGLMPLLPPYAKQSEWEIAIEMLMDLTEGQQSNSAAATKQESVSRIVYYVDQYEQVIPRLQKSKDGLTWSKGRNIALSTFKQQTMPEMNDTDRRVAALVRCYSGGWGAGDTWELEGSLALTALAGYPWVFQAENPDVPIVVTKEEAQIVVTKATGGYRVNANVTPPFGSTSVLKKENDQLYRVVTMTPMQRKILETLSRASYYPISGKDRLAELLTRLSKSITVHSDLLQNSETLDTVKGSTLITVQLQPIGDGIKAELFVKPLIEQPPYCKAGEGVSSVIGMVKGKRVQAVRNLKKEADNFQVISRLLQQVSGDRTATDVLYFDDYYQCLDLIDALRQQTTIARTEWPEGVKFTINRSADFSNLKLSFKGVGQWFEVDGELNVDARTQIKIGELLQKVRESKGRFIALNDSEFLALSKQLRRQLEEIDAMLMRDKKKLQISQLNISSMGELEQLGVSLTKDKAFTDLQKRMERAGQEKYVVPKSLQAELRSYQEDGFRWMSRLAHWGAGACLADDMGLGKTIQSIALMLSRGKQGASLVIAPASVLLNWKNEIERFAPSLSAVVMHDADGGREKLVSEASDFDVVLTTYGLLIKEAELLAGKQWNVIILDEAHTIKNKETKMSKAAMALNGEFRLLLTGTPLQNHLGEIWNLFQFANPGLLGSFQHFNESFIQPIERGEDKQRQKQLKKILLPFLLRRTKTEVLDELPEKTEITVQVELSDEERVLYENLRQQAMLNLEEKAGGAMQTLTEITRLRQAACHPALVDKKLTLTSSKTQAFLKLADELMTNNHRALVFSQFTSHLALIRKELDDRGIEYLYLDGSVTVNERIALVKKFQTGDQPLFLISLKAGGTGLNLTAADYVIHLDPWWNPAVEDQASDRVHRIGQTRPVTIYRLIAVQTIEEKIIKLHQTKKSLADSLLDGSDIAHKLTKEEMLELLRGADY